MVRQRGPHLAGQRAHRPADRRSTSPKARPKACAATWPSPSRWWRRGASATRTRSTSTTSPASATATTAPSGMGFDTAQLGVRAQMQLLKSYAETDPDLRQPARELEAARSRRLLPDVDPADQEVGQRPELRPEDPERVRGDARVVVDRAGHRAWPTAGAGRGGQPGVDLHDDLDVHHRARSADLAGLKPTRRSPGLPSRRVRGDVEPGGWA